MYAVLQRDNWLMLTDVPPRDQHRAGFDQSDRNKTLALPGDPLLTTIAAAIESAMETGKAADVRKPCTEFLVRAAEFYKVPSCSIRVLAARPLHVRENWTTELFGDYDPGTMNIRLWMRTAVRKDVTSFGTFLNTLCHGFCHHLDFHLFKYSDSWHTRGFYDRTAALYHLARGTPRKPLFWASQSGGRWRIDWQRIRRGG